MKKKLKSDSTSLEFVMRALYLLYASGTYCLNNILTAQRRPQQDRQYLARLRAEHAEIDKKLELLEEQIK